MKYPLKIITINLLILTISACNNQSDNNGEQAAPVLKGEVSVESESHNSDNHLPSQENVTKQQENEDTQPFSLDEFRNAIDEVVQESIQEDVEKAVQDEVAKQAQKKR